MRWFGAYGDDYWRYAAPAPHGGFYPPVEWGGGMAYGLEGPGPYYHPLEEWGYGREFAEPGGYGREYGRRYGRRRPPRESPTYGRRADAYLRQWARRHGLRPERHIDTRPWRERRRRGEGAGRRSGRYPRGYELE